MIPNEPGSTTTKPGPKPGSNKNTNTNNNKPDPQPSYIQTIPGISPGSAAGYGSQLQGLIASRTAAISSIKAQQGVLRGQLVTDRANIKSQLIEAVRKTENMAMEAGTVGSSAGQEAQAANAGAAAAARLEAKTKMLAGLQGLKLEKGQAQAQFLLGLGSIQAAKAAEQAQAAADAYATGTQIPGSGGNQGGGGVGPVVSAPPADVDMRPGTQQYDGDNSYLQHTQKDLPSWYTVGLYKWKGAILENHALASYQDIAKKIGFAIPLTGDGYRSYAAQVAAQNNPNAAPPGQSYHQLGLAIDVNLGAMSSSNQAKAIAALKAAGWHQLSGEPWHFSYIVSG